MKIPNSIVTPYFQWMYGGGFIGKVTRKGIVFKRGNDIAIIYNEDCKKHESYEMNEYCQKRYEMFLKQYLNNGRSFIESLDAKMDAVMIKHKAELVKMGYWELLK